MAISNLRALLFAGAGAVITVGGAYVTGVMDMLTQSPPANFAEAPKTDRPGAENPAAPEAPKAEIVPAAPKEEVVAKADPAAPANPAITLPTFDVVRVEKDGSVVIAGKCGPAWGVEAVESGNVLGGSTSDSGGDFAIVLANALQPGDHVVSLRARKGDVTAVSLQTAIISIPQKSDGELLVMVEEPGKPAEILAAPDKPVEIASAEPVAPAQPAAAPEKPAEIAAADPAKPADAAKQPAIAAQVSIRAIEIEGDIAFVAGSGTPGHEVRVYFNEDHVGGDRTKPDGSFLVEVKRVLAVGTYQVRADLLAAAGEVIARGVVPFEREEGDKIAAVAPEQPAQPEKPAVPDKPAAPEKPAEIAAADPAKPAEPVAPEKPAEVAADPAPPSVEPPAVVAPKLEATANSVIIRRGDTLWRISKRVYGRGVRFSTIYTANQKQISDPDRIWPGQVFAVPEKSEGGEAADWGAISDRLAPKDGAPTQ